jgi:hypothetical protein
MSLLKRVLPALPVLAVFLSAQAHAQFESWNHYAKDHGASISVGATGNYLYSLSSNPTPQTLTTVTNGVSQTATFSNQRQEISQSTGFLTSLQFHPVPWAGIEVNYGYQHYSEYFLYNLSTTPAQQATRVKTTSHEATAAYQFHAKRIPLQPFLNIGGGAIDFVPTSGGPNQWRGVGLAETGFEVSMPYTQRHLGLRLQGRGLFYRAPNFNSAQLSSRGWRVSAEPSASFVYRF